MTPLDEEFDKKWLDAFKRKAERHGNSFWIELDFDQVAALIGMVQLALRHPSTENLRPAERARFVITHIIDTLTADGDEDAAVIRKGLMAGFDSQNDR